MAYVYRHIRLDKKEPFYIGISNSDTNYYRANHRTTRNKIWKSIASKTDISVEILIDNITWEEACEKEKEFIELYGMIINNSGTLCNLTKGGDSNIGRIPWNKGIKGIVKASEETKLKMSLASKGKKLSDEHKSKIGKSNKNMSEETRKKLSDINKGNKNFLGKKHKDSSKIINSYKKGLKILDINNCVCHFGCTSAAMFLNISASSVRNQACGMRKNKYNLSFIN